MVDASVVSQPEETKLAKLPNAKMHTNFNKPESIKYEKKLFMNALSVLVIREFNFKIESHDY